jgi:hypothetical protein
VFVSHFPHCSGFSPYPYPRVCVSHFPCFSVFSPYSRS